MMKFVSPIIRMFKSLLQPKGTLDVSILKLNECAAFNSAFMEQIYKELDTAFALHASGIQDLTACQRLVFHVLTDSANLDSDPEKLKRSLDFFLENEKKQSI